jgi:methionine transaminase
VASLAQAFHTTAWPLAYTAAPHDISKEIRRVFYMMSPCVNSPMQRAMATVYSNMTNKPNASEIFQKKRDLFINSLDGSLFKATPSKGSCYQLILMSKPTLADDKELAQFLTLNHGIATAPLSIFNHEKSKGQYLRVNLSQPDEVLIEAAQRLCEVK